jgi:hypothetical protein
MALPLNFGLRADCGPEFHPRFFGGGNPAMASITAASVAALLITTEAMVAELPKKNAGGAGMPAGGGGMGGMDF